MPQETCSKEYVCSDYSQCLFVEVIFTLVTFEIGSVIVDSYTPLPHPWLNWSYTEKCFMHRAMFFSFFVVWMF